MFRSVSSRMLLLTPAVSLWSPVFFFRLYNCRHNKGVCSINFHKTINQFRDKVRHVTDDEWTVLVTETVRIEICPECGLSAWSSNPYCFSCVLNKRWTNALLEEMMPSWCVFWPFDLCLDRARWMFWRNPSPFDVSFDLLILTRTSRPRESLSKPSSFVEID